MNEIVTGRVVETKRRIVYTDYAAIAAAILTMIFAAAQLIAWPTAIVLLLQTCRVIRWKEVD